MSVVYDDPPPEPPDLPITSASICTCCGQLLHPSNPRIGRRPEAEFEFEPGYEPDPDEELDFETWQNLPGTWIHYCPHCYCLFSAKPPHPVVIIDADKYPQIENLIEKRDSLQERHRIHERNLRRIEERLAFFGLDLNLKLENARDQEKELIYTVTQELRTVEQKIQNRLRSLRL